MIFTNNINDLINVKTDSYLHNPNYSSTKLFKYYNAKFVCTNGKRVIINNKNSYLRCYYAYYNNNNNNNRAD